uniref:hypothetical protein n=1 Tax=Gemmatimonas sp. TaxID=1962908 RepID=UPI003341809A
LYLCDKVHTYAATAVICASLRFIRPPRDVGAAAAALSGKDGAARKRIALKLTETHYKVNARESDL